MDNTNNKTAPVIESKFVMTATAMCPSGWADEVDAKLDRHDAPGMTFTQLRRRGMDADNLRDALRYGVDRGFFRLSMWIKDAAWDAPNVYATVEQMNGKGFDWQGIYVYPAKQDRAAS